MHTTWKTKNNKPDPRRVKRGKMQSQAETIEQYHKEGRNKAMMKKANYVVTANNNIVYPVSRMYTFTECERICKQYNRECGENLYKAVKFTTAAGLNK